MGRMKGEDVVILNEPCPRGRDRADINFMLLHVGNPDVARVSCRLKYSCRVIIVPVDQLICRCTFIYCESANPPKVPSRYLYLTLRSHI